VVVAAAARDEACPPGGACSKGAVGTDNLLLQVARAQRATRDDRWAGWFPGDPEDAFQGVQRRRRYKDMGSCRRRHSTVSSNPPEEANLEWQCRGQTMVKVGSPPPTESSTAPPRTAPQCGGTSNSTGACLCMFDIDRTLTGRQGDTHSCPHNRVLGYHDSAYGGGQATLSALTAAGIKTTFCNQCHLGITSAGHGSGAGSPWNDYLLDHVMRGQVHDAFMRRMPHARQWSEGTGVHSPFVLKQGNKVKQEAVELVRQWYGRQGVCIEPEEVYFFEDRTENVKPFAEKGLNSREISCGSRDPSLYGGTGMVGYCGARPEEVQRAKGNILCG